MTFVRPHCAAFLAVLLASPLAAGEMKTWDGEHSIEKIEVTVVYYVPKDRRPLADWRERVDYYCRRIEAFHQREFQGQSVMKTNVVAEPLVSERTTEELRVGDGDAIFFRTLRESDARLAFAREKGEAFPILLVLSEINWRPLDDFYRLQPGPEGPKFEGNYNGSEHFPGAASGGARATYLARDRKGWGLVSADGWRVPYRGADCVVYHEGCGHTVGLPHPQPGNGSVMSLGQYKGWISESWLDRDQKVRLGWEPPEAAPDRTASLYDHFRALPEPRVPKPGEEVGLALDWPKEAKVKALRVRYQTDVHGPWVGVHPRPVEPCGVGLGSFDQYTPISYRVDAELADGQTAELWGYLQVRANPRQPVIPAEPLPELAPPAEKTESSAAASGVKLPGIEKEIDALAKLELKENDLERGWKLEEGKLLTPKAYGARIELPLAVPAEYQLTAVVEPLDAPNGLILGQLLEGRRCLVLLNYTPGEGRNRASLSAIENIDGENVGNGTTYTGPLFRPGRLSQVVVTARRQGITVTVDGRAVIDWQGEPSRLSLSDYWHTPHADRIFLGAYDCRYRFHRVSLLPLGE